MKSTKIPDYMWKHFELPIPEKEYKFHPQRKWRIDYCYPEKKIAIEIEGGLYCFGGGRHNRATSMIKDMEKYNALTELGWRLLRYVPNDVKYKEIKRVYESLK